MIISVVIPVLNDPDGLLLTLASIPTAPDLELIVVDGGSTDQTQTVLETYRSRFAELIVGEDNGIADAMNLGIHRSTGDWITILNAGDCWLPETLATVRKHLTGAVTFDILHGTVEYEDQGGGRYRIAPDVSRLKERMFVFHPTLFVSARCYERVGAYDPSYQLAMDSNWCHRAIEAKAVFFDCGKALARMALGGRSDASYLDALREYRRSVIAHGLADSTTAHWNFVKLAVGKTLSSHLGNRSTTARLRSLLRARLR